MIFSIFFYLGGAIVNGFTSIFNLINFAIPPEIIDSITYFISYLKYLGFIFPINTLMKAFGTVLSFGCLVFIIKIILWLWQFVPYFGKKVDLPQLDEKNMLDLTGRPNTVNLKSSNHSKGRIWRDTKDIH